MGKRTTGKFERRRQDAYDTPRAAIEPLLHHLPPNCRFVEPCAGRGDLLEFLILQGHECVGAFDIEPRDEGRWLIEKRDALKLFARDYPVDFDLFITNPAWSRPILHALILHFYWQKPTWLLFDADWMHTEQAAPYMPMCRNIVSVGRVRWIPGSKNDGVDNAAWYLFDKPDRGAEIVARR